MKKSTFFCLLRSALFIFYQKFYHTRDGCREAAKRATPPCLLEVCTDERRDGPGRSDATYRPTGPENSQVHIVDNLPYVQILDVPVPQLGGGLVEFMQKLDTVTPEQVIEVPKLSQDSTAFCVTSSAGRRTVGGSADCVVLRLAPAALPSRSSTFQFRVVEVVDGEVLKVFPQDRIPQHGLWSGTLTLKFLVDALKVFSHDRVRCSALLRWRSAPP